MRKILLTITLFSTCALSGILIPRGFAKGQTVAALPDGHRQIDPERTLGVYQGFGIGMHPGDVIYEDAIEALDLEYVRIEFGPLWYALPERIPDGVSVEALVEFIARNYNGDAPDRLAGAKYTHQFLRERAIQLILIHFELPYHWRKDKESGLFLEEYIDDLARFYTAHLIFLKSQGIEIDYIELANEPDGHWNGRLVPESYARLVRECGQLFEEFGLSDVKILGPGLAFLNLYGQTPAYMNALAGETSHYLHGWSAHVWDEVEFTSARAEYIYGVWQPFLDGIAKGDPEGKKPIFVTEYGCDVLNFSGREYVSPRDRITETAVDSWDYAVRVVANSITNLNRGANALVLYRLSNAHWHKTGWGIIQPETDETYRKKPVYTAVERFIADLPLDAEVLQPVWYEHDDPVIMSVLRSPQTGELTLLLVNERSEAETMRLRLPDVWSSYIVDSLGGLDSQQEQQASASLRVDCGESVLDVQLPALTVARIQLSDTNIASKVSASLQ